MDVDPDELSRYAMSAGLQALINTAIESKKPGAADILEEYTEVAANFLEGLFDESGPGTKLLWDAATTFILGLFGGTEGILEGLSRGVEFDETWAQFVGREHGPAMQVLMELNPANGIDALVNHDPEKPWTIHDFLGAFGPVGTLAQSGVIVAEPALETVVEGAEKMASYIGSVGKTVLWIAGGTLIFGALVGVAVLAGKRDR